MKYKTNATIQNFNSAHGDRHICAGCAAHVASPKVLRLVYVAAINTIPIRSFPRNSSAEDFSE